MHSSNIGETLFYTWTNRLLHLLFLLVYGVSFKMGDERHTTRPCFDEYSFRSAGMRSPIVDTRCATI